MKGKGTGANFNSRIEVVEFPDEDGTDFTEKTFTVLAGTGCGQAGSAHWLKAQEIFPGGEDCYFEAFPKDFLFFVQGNHQRFLDAGLFHARQ